MIEQELITNSCADNEKTVKLYPKTRIDAITGLEGNDVAAKDKKSLIERLNDIENRLAALEGK